MVVWTPENKKKAWITKRVNSLLRRGAGRELAIREAEEAFEKSKIMDKWTEKEKLKSEDFEKIRNEKVLSLMLNKNMNREEAIKIIEDEETLEDEEDNFIDDELLIDVAGIKIRYDGRQYILTSPSKNYQTYYTDLKYCLKELLKQEMGFNLSKKNIDTVLGFVNELNRAENKIADIADTLDRKMEKILNDSISQR